METQLESLKSQLFKHPLYPSIDSEVRLQHFMRSHVFSVWDFQSLLKALQLHLTGVTIPWQPTPDPEARRLINEIVLDEESAPHPEGGYASHFELYLDAMCRAGVDCTPIEQLLARVASGVPVLEALQNPELPQGAARFVQTTFEIIERGKLHELVAAFAYGREDIIPGMFQQLVARLAQSRPERWGMFRHYLDEHILHDEERHGPMARALLERVCGEDPRKWEEAWQTARQAIQARLALWDTLEQELNLAQAA